MAGVFVCAGGHSVAKGLFVNLVRHGGEGHWCVVHQGAGTWSSAIHQQLIMHCTPMHLMAIIAIAGRWCQLCVRGMQLPQKLWACRASIQVGALYISSRVRQEASAVVHGCDSDVS
jgi:hypothetical protein